MSARLIVQVLRIIPVQVLRPTEVLLRTTALRVQPTALPQEVLRAIQVAVDTVVEAVLREAAVEVPVVAEADLVTGDKKQLFFTIRTENKQLILKT